GPRRHACGRPKGRRLARTKGRRTRALSPALASRLGPTGDRDQVDERTFALAPLGEPLRRDHPRSLARLAAQRTDPWWQAWGVLYHSIKTGGTAFEHAYGAPFFSTLSSDPEAAARFDDYMSELAVPLATSVAQVIDLAGTAHLVDVGGGRGTFAIELARRWPALRPTVFDLPGVAQRARTEIEAVGLSKRCDAVGGDF